MSGCEYCSDVRSELSGGCDAKHGEGVEVEMSHGRWLLAVTGHYDIGGIQLLEAAYCPICGRKLDKEES